MNKDNEEIKYETEEDTEKAEHKIKKTKDKLGLCEQERAEYLGGWQRAKADLINYKKEQESKISEIFKFANEGLIYEILPVLDSFELAIKHGADEGTKQLYNQLKGILKNQGLEEIQALGEKFNPEFHESVGEAESGEQGIVAEEIQKGYKFNNKIIRASKVKINK
ncbi:MAG: nucleotide exchange factor GrpE [Candidatus Portnoybacteria bacterium]|nr:nucleotide exchange factor GrpE [Candidatus Portnoybacteria bacterium]